MTAAHFGSTCSKSCCVQLLQEVLVSDDLESTCRVRRQELSLQPWALPLQRDSSQSASSALIATILLPTKSRAFSTRLSSIRCVFNPQHLGRLTMPSIICLWHGQSTTAGQRRINPCEFVKASYHESFHASCGLPDSERCVHACVASCHSGVHSYKTVGLPYSRLALRPLHKACWCHCYVQGSGPFG